MRFVKKSNNGHYDIFNIKVFYLVTDLTQNNVRGNVQFWNDPTAVWSTVLQKSWSFRMSSTVLLAVFTCCKTFQHKKYKHLTPPFQKDGDLLCTSDNLYRPTPHTPIIFRLIISD